MSILDSTFWSKRLRAAGKLRHQAVYHCTKDAWEEIEAKHIQILHQHIKPGDSILDVGCAWGRLLNMLPPDWKGTYLGFDLSPEFIRIAKEEHPDQRFVVAHLQDLSWLTEKFDWAVLVSIRPMIQRHLGSSTWNIMERNLREYCKKLLYLEYDPNCGGMVE